MLEDKISQFLSLLHHFEDEIDVEKSMSSFYFVVGFLLIFRLILDTELHPRTGRFSPPHAASCMTSCAACRASAGRQQQPRP